MTTIDPFTQFKAIQKEGWAAFAPLEAITTMPAAKLVSFAGVANDHNVLDVACGTGVVAVTAARRGAKVEGLDLSPALLERARQNAKTAEVDIDFTEGDVEALPYPDARFDVVVSQFGHMFGPRPEVALSEMLRVLKPRGRIAFSTWPPEMFIGRLFTLVAQYLPPPAGAAPPPLWGEPHVIRERLGDRVVNLEFERDVVLNPSLSPRHTRQTFETTAAPNIRIKQEYAEKDPDTYARFNASLENLIAAFSENNHVKQHYLMTRATKKG
ncbi:MAG: class I SAM-dependent methyltransferase [Acidobacteria bacterium]|nr:class I SAM-dependent methyltransferase [Acidobacteriota bacterium]